MEDADLTDRLAERFSSGEHLERLCRDGFTVIDDALESAHARVLSEEIRKLEEDGHFEPNRVQFSIPGRQQPIVATKPGVFEIDLHDAGKRSNAPHLSLIHI